VWLLFSGSFSVDQYLDVIGQVADDANPFLLCLEVIDTLSVRFTATSRQCLDDQDVTPGTTARPRCIGRKQPVFNRGTTTTTTPCFLTRPEKNSVLSVSVGLYKICVPKIFH